MKKSGFFSSASLNKLLFKVKKISLALGLGFILMTPGLSQAGRVDEPPTPAAMIADVMVRPVMAGATVLGAGLFLATLPFSLAGGDAGLAGNVLVVQPFKATFLRCLGCTNSNAVAYGGHQDVDE